MPKLWNDTIEAHRREVRDATLETTAALVAKHGLRSVTMSQIAEETGIGRATLYKYYPDVEAILVAWHEGHVAVHLAQPEDRVADRGRQLLEVGRRDGLIVSRAGVPQGQPEDEADGDRDRNGRGRAEGDGSGERAWLARSTGIVGHTPRVVQVLRFYRRKPTTYLPICRVEK